MWFRKISAATALMLAIGMTAQAQHDGDVIFEYNLGKIVIESGELSSTGPANRFFEGAFGTSGLLNGFTSDPGFEAHKPIGPGDAIGFNIHSHNGNFLHYFDPTLNSLSAGHNKSLKLDWLGVGDLTINRTVGGSGPINIAAPSGAFHTHFAGIELGSKTTADFGSYGFLMSLNSSAGGIANSDPFWMVFNYGMEEPAFEASLTAFNITAVPEPSTFVLVSLSIGGLAWSRRKKLLGANRM